MITFDKLKIVADIDTIEITDDELFEKVDREGERVALQFYQEKPFLLTIIVDYVKKEVVIEFGGKILGKDYPKLISVETIAKCFENINALGLCSIDVEAVMAAEVVIADVTKDVRGVNVPQLTKYLRSHISNYHLYSSRIVRGSNFEINKNVVSKRTKMRMMIYDKSREMQTVENRRFVETNDLEHIFDDTCRFELNLKSKKQIRDALKISNNKLKNVLASPANPIRDFLEKVIISVDDPIDGPVVMTSKKEYLTKLVLQDCQYDLEKVEAKMRELHPNRGTNFKKLMEPYRMMMEQMKADVTPNYFQNILEKLG